MKRLAKPRRRSEDPELKISMMIPIISRTRRGHALISTLLILFVIALLTIIAIPVYLHRDQNAKLDQAQTEVYALGHAMQAVGRIHKVYVPLQMLDDMPVGPDALQPRRTDDIGNEPARIHLIKVNQAAAAQIDSQISLRWKDQPFARRLRNQWQGPFVQTKRIYTGQDPRVFDPSGLDRGSIMCDYPLDPWGAPYRFYSPVGIIGSKADRSNPKALQNIQFSDGALTTHDDRFDRYAIVSFGPDGKSDSAPDSGESDDIIYLFGKRDPRSQAMNQVPLDPGGRPFNISQRVGDAADPTSPSPIDPLAGIEIQSRVRRKKDSST